MQIASSYLRAAVAVLGAGALSIILFVFLGVLLPVWTMIAIYGRSAVQDTPGHGSIVLFAAVPIAGLVSLPAFLFLTASLYRKTDRKNRGNHNFSA
jgi:hypothetical protein